MMQDKFEFRQINVRDKLKDGIKGYEEYEFVYTIERELAIEAKRVSTTEPIKSTHKITTVNN
jgi:hypothetical protein